MGSRYLVVVADDYGMGPEISRGIRELMHVGSVTGTVLMVNSPHAENDVRLWHRQGTPGDLGWHPCLNMDAPLSPIGEVSSLVGLDGNLLPLGKWMARFALGQIRYRDIVTELAAQYCRCCELVGHPPMLINGHKHIHVFPMVSQALIEVTRRYRVSPYVRRVRESWGSLRRIPGARIKRAFLSTLGARSGHRQARAGLPGNDYLAGITDPNWVEDPEFYARWLHQVPGHVVELAVHPGYHDDTLIGRDCAPADGQLQRRVTELRMLKEARFHEACRSAGFTLVSAFQLLCPGSRGLRHAG